MPFVLSPPSSLTCNEQILHEVTSSLLVFMQCCQFSHYTVVNFAMSFTIYIYIQVTLDHLLPANKTYWHYSGSLTTPPCSEVVQWYVFSQHLIVPDEVIQKWSTLPSESVLPSNYRNVQQLNGRNVWLMRDSN